MLRYAILLLDDLMFLNVYRFSFFFLDLISFCAIWL
jgi:hypothetical protein